MEIEDINTCYPARIVSFDPETQTCTCKLSIEDYYTSDDESFLKQAAPLMLDVPVYSPSGSGWAITFPIKEGDDCLVLFAQKGYDQWLYSGAQETGLVNGIPTPEHYREFSIRDGICLVGVKPIPSAIKDYQPDDVEIRNTDRKQRITLKANGDIEISTENNINITSNTVNLTAKNANVNADNVVAISKDIKVTTDAAQVTCPDTKFIGNVSVSGVVNCAGISMGASARGAGECNIIGTVKIQGQTIMTGDLSVSSDATIGGKSFLGHTHTGNQGSPTSPPL